MGVDGKVGQASSEFQKGLAFRTTVKAVLSNGVGDVLSGEFVLQF